MLYQIFSGSSSFGEKLLLLLISAIALFPALTVHEWAHGFMAYKLGDSTAKADGRLSLNPLDHLDPIGSIMLLLVGFGWAKPVPVMTRNFKKPRRDFALVSLAGPIANFIMALFSALFYVGTLYFCIANGYSGETAKAIVSIFEMSLLFNVGLGLFNLIPLPPLDGSNVVMCLLPNRLAAKYSRIRYYTQYIFIGLMLIRHVPVLDFIHEWIFWPLNVGRGLIIDLLVKLADLIFYPIFF